MYFTRLFLGGVSVLLGLLSSIPSSTSFAADNHNWPVRSSDEPAIDTRDCANGRKLDSIVLPAKMIGSEASVLVFDPAGELRTAADPAKAVDFRNDTWIFDPYGNGRAALIIKFQQEENKSVALLYDDRNNDGVVAYDVFDCQVRILESPYWTAKAEADGDWLLPSGLANANVRLLIDGPLGHELDPEPVLNRMRNNGQPDTEWVMYDQDNDGVPEAAYEHLLTDIPRTYGIHRFSAYSNEGRRVPLKPQGYALWPLLYGSVNVPLVINVEDLPSAGNYFDTAFYFSMNWQTAKIKDAGLHGYPIEQGFHITSTTPLQLGPESYQPNFENPMAYYDLADDHDGKPELHIRVELGASTDVGTIPTPVEVIRYSWDQLNHSAWDYKVDLIGRYPIDDEVSFRDFSTKTIPYDRLPTWVTSKVWDAATFVAADSIELVTSEGIYDAPTTPYRPYILGLDPEPPIEKVGMGVGVRAEYWLDRRQQPWLYFSPIDRKLHLKGLQGGYWRVDNGHRVVYDDGNKDSLIDTWFYDAQNADGDYQREQEVHFLADRAILYDVASQAITIKAVKTQFSTFETLPPTNHKEWSELGQQLATQPQPLAGAATNLKALLDQFDGPQLVIPRAGASQLRALSASSFRFAMDLHEDERTLLGDSTLFPAVAGLAAGSYLVVYDQQTGFRIEALTPAHLRLDSVQTTLPNVVALNPTQLALTVSNDGSADLRQGHLSVVAKLNERRISAPIGEVTVDLNAGESQRLVFPWAPRFGGQWEIEVEDPYSETSNVFSTSIDVLPSPQPVVLDLIKAQELPVLTIQFVALLLVVSGLMAGVLGASQLARGTRRGVRAREELPDG